MKTTSHQHVLKKWQSSPTTTLPVITKMADRLIYRLRRNQYQCRTVWLYLSLVGYPGLMAERHFDAPTRSQSLLLSTIHQLATSFPQELPGAIRKVTLGFNGLTEAGSGLQLDLFSTFSKEESLSQALQYVRSRFGFESLQMGSTYRLKKHEAKEEIGFGRLKDRTLPGKP